MLTMNKNWSFIVIVSKSQNKPQSNNLLTLKIQNVTTTKIIKINSFAEQNYRKMELNLHNKQSINWVYLVHYWFKQFMQSLFLSSVGLVVTGEGIAFLGFMERHPSILAKMVTFGLASAAGQVRETIIILN